MSPQHRMKTWLQYIVIFFISPNSFVVFGSIKSVVAYKPRHIAYLTNHLADAHFSVAPFILKFPSGCGTCARARLPL